MKDVNQIVSDAKAFIRRRQAKGACRKFRKKESGQKILFAVLRDATCLHDGAKNLFRAKNNCSKMAHFSVSSCLVYQKAFSAFQYGMLSQLLNSLASLPSISVRIKNHLNSRC